jgi:hypothetical protein
MTQEWDLLLDSASFRRKPYSVGQQISGKKNIFQKFELTHCPTLLKLTTHYYHLCNELCCSKKSNIWFTNMSEIVWKTRSDRRRLMECLEMTNWFYKPFEPDIPTLTYFSYKFIISFSCLFFKDFFHNQHNIWNQKICYVWLKGCSVTLGHFLLKCKLKVRKI